MQKIFLLTALVFAFQSSSMICSELRPIAQQDIITKWLIILKAEKLAREELGPGATSWQVVDKAQDPKILEKAQEEYHKQKQAKQQSNDNK